MTTLVKLALAAVVVWMAIIAWGALTFLATLLMIAF